MAIQRFPQGDSSSVVVEAAPALLFWGVVVSLVWLCIQRVRQANRSDLRSLPGPTAARWTGFYRPWKLRDGGAHDFYRALHQKYGAIVRTAPNVVSVSDPKAITTIYAIGTKFYKTGFYSVFDMWYKDTAMPSMFSVRDPAEHQALRRPVAQKFSMSSIKAMEPFADDCTDIFMEAMTDREGQDIDLGVWLQWYAFDVIAAITFHRRLGFMEKRVDVHNMIEDIGKALEVAALIGQVPSLHPWMMGNKWFAKFIAWQAVVKVPDPLRTVVKFTEECIEEYDQNPPEKDRPDFLGWLRQTNAKGDVMPDRQIVNHLANNLLAGSDTTAISLRAIFYYLAQNPKCYQKAQREVDDADRDGLLSEHVTYAECLQLPYLQAAMKEAMRCNPGVSFPLERTVPSGGAEICGTHLSEGTIVGVNPAVIHHDTSVFGDDAGEFNPERWLTSDEERIKHMDRHLMTFGYGSRTCIGKNISIMEMGKLVPQVLRNFDLEWASPQKAWKVETFWFARQEGLIYRLTRRQRSQ
ncbi:Pisatin demethylase [Purpureocillium lavendulum]|uniref:Pisatin demethylase n=1 Tax=Purpureocillium lavendulum TaxID=1247861 RepID=A0AB34FUH4_9HYPO|nr:Pisatin demethylase [Purpureocillium lavendulum]